MKIFTIILEFSIISILLINIVLSRPKWYYTKKGIRFLIEPDYKYNWFQASRECARRDLQMIALDTEHKNVQLTNVLTKEFGKPLNFWLGCNDEFVHTQDKNRTFYWTTTGEKLSFTNWHPNRPNDPEEHCAHIWEKSDTFQWDDNVCQDRKYGFICEEKLFLAPTCKKIVDEIVNNPCSKRLDYILTGLL